MKPTTAQAGNSETSHRVIEQLKASPFFQTYQNAFRKATGLPLVVVSATAGTFNPCRASSNQNAFCQALNLGENPCSQCVLSQKGLMDSRTGARARTASCFAGLKETLVPIRLGRNTFGYLLTGQVFTTEPCSKAREGLNAAMVQQGRTKKEMERMQNLYLQTPRMEKDQYAAMVTLLSAFALQLGGVLNEIILEDRPEEPETVRTAKEFIMDRIDEKLTLEQVAEEVGVSTFYFCKLFKQATGMTFTEYVNRQRVELAKTALRESTAPVTEVAFSVGYQSLSQFNRSFLRITGESPTRFRKGSVRRLDCAAA
ncbi:MAG: helix-turn-helix domain-containing protein [Verrucomicrobiota bacterium]